MNLNLNVVNSPQTVQAPLRESLDKPFKEYRLKEVSAKGVLTAEEYDVFKAIFDQLATASLFSLALNQWNINQLKQKVAHVHPFNALELLNNDPEMKAYFFSIIEKKPFIWTRCKSAFKEEIKEQDGFQNIQPYIESFSRKMRLNPTIVSGLISDNELDSLIDYLIENSKNDYFS